MHDWVDALRQQSRRVRVGGALFRSGDAFTSLYAVYAGLFKTEAVDGAGREQVTGFFMPGELLGLEGLAAARHEVTAVALEDSSVAVIPYAEASSLQRELHAALAMQIVREHEMMLLLGSMRAEQRLAAFLCDLSSRLRQRGYSGSEFLVRMTREDIGSYLGMTLETVSRLFSRFRVQGVLEVRQRQVRLLDLEGLRRLAARDCAAAWRTSPPGRPRGPR